MNTGQMMLVIGGFTLLSVLVLNINGVISGAISVGLEMEATLNAVSLGQSLMDEIMRKDFDERSINTRVYTPSGMTAVSNLGKDSGELLTNPDTLNLSRTVLDDIDDYHGYRRKSWNDRLGWYTLDVRVEYADELEPDNTSSSRTFAKRVTISVSNQYLPKSIASPDTPAPLVLKDVAIYRRYF